MSADTIDSPRFIEILKVMARDLKEHAEELRQLDAQLGDGDLGVTAELSYKAMSEYLATTEETDIGKLLMQCGMNINRHSPSTFGTILASAFMGGGKAVLGKFQLEAEDLILVGDGAIENIKKRGKAEVGDKTLLDAFVPAVEAFKAELNRGNDVVVALDAAVKASESGMKDTVRMKAMFGRAKWFQEGSIGVQDGGATAIHYMIKSFADAYTG